MPHHGLSALSLNHTHLVPDLEVLDLVTLLHNLSHKLMPTDEARRTLQMAAVVMQVAAAQCGRGDFEDGIGWLLQGWVWTVFNGDLQ